MLMLVAAVMADPLPGSDRASVTCDISRTEIRDALQGSRDPQLELYLDPGSPAMTSCPALHQQKAGGTSLADDDAWARANVHAPRPRIKVKEAKIFSIGASQFASDMQSATVKVSYTCTGLCGEGWTSRYVRTSSGWRRDGYVGPIYVS